MRLTVDHCPSAAGSPERLERQAGDIRQSGSRVRATGRQSDSGRRRGAVLPAQTGARTRALRASAGSEQYAGLESGSSRDLISDLCILAARDPSRFGGHRALRSRGKSTSARGAGLSSKRKLLCRGRDHPFGWQPGRCRIYHAAQHPEQRAPGDRSFGKAFRRRGRKVLLHGSPCVARSIAGSVGRFKPARERVYGRTCRAPRSDSQTGRDSCGERPGLSRDRCAQKQAGRRKALPRGRNSYGIQF